MALALSLLITGPAADAVRAIWHGLAAHGVSSDMIELGYPPHLTLVTSDHAEAEFDMDAALSALESHPPLVFQLANVRRFAGTDVVWIGCGDETGLRQLHEKISRHIPASVIRPHYRAENWTPHVTLQTRGDGAQGLALAEACWQPVQAHAHQLELARFPPPVAIRTLDLPDSGKEKAPPEGMGRA